MRAVIQRVSRATISINNSETRTINAGMLILLSIEEVDSREDLEWLINKLVRLRIFADGEDKMNLSVQDIQGELMVVSQFTLHASTKKGNRPSWIKAAPPSVAEPLYQEFIDHIKKTSGLKVVTGEFGAHMDIELVNDGPVTIFIDSKLKE